MSDNPFLLPPGGAKPAPADPSHYIAVPASVESATHRIAREPPATGGATGPGAQNGADASAPAEDTRVAPPRRWALVLPDGVRVSLDGPLLLGRDPAGIPDRPDAGLLPLTDSGKTVSKTHALLEPSAEGVRVRELHSTNGIAIDTAAGRQLLTPGGDDIAPPAATIMLGSFAIRVVAV